MRDAVLAISGKLDLEPPVGSAVARAGEGRAGPGPRIQPGRLRTCTGRSTCRSFATSCPSRSPCSTSPTQPGDRRAGDDQRAVAGAVPDEQPVRDPPGRGRRPPAASAKVTTMTRGSRPPICGSWRGRRTGPRQSGRVISSPGSPRLRRGTIGDDRPHGAPGRLSARHFTPAPSSAISIELWPLSLSDRKRIPSSCPDMTLCCRGGRC